MENLDPVLGVVRWAAERVARSKALRWRVSHRKEGRSVSDGIDGTERRKNLLHARTKRERQPDQGSQGKCAR